MRQNFRVPCRAKFLHKIIVWESKASIGTKLSPKSLQLMFFCKCFQNVITAQGLKNRATAICYWAHTSRSDKLHGSQSITAPCYFFN